MAKSTYHNRKGKQDGKNQGGCCGIIVLSFLWIGIVSVIVSEVIAPAHKSSVLLNIAIVLLLLLPLWIKPLCLLIAKCIKSALAKQKSSRQSPMIVETGKTETSDPAQGASPIPDVLPLQTSPKPEIGSNHAEPKIPAVPVTAQPEATKADSSITSFTEVLLDKSAKVKSELLTIDLMEGHQFEAWCADALKNSGFSQVSVTPGSGDQGVDVLAEKDGIKYAIQCKRYTTDLGNTPIQEVHSGKDFYHRHVGVVITNQHFTDGAKDLADATGTLLWDREWITNYLERKHGSDKVDAPQSHIDKHEGDNELDELYYAAVDVILESGIASVSMLQRRLKLGYARASRIVDQMEEQGVVGPFQGSKPRDILITKEQWQAMLRSTKAKT